MAPGDRRVTAVLGPTNTGKTHYAVERMLAHRTGVIGLPLRLLAREVYDRIVALRGPSVVALVTGEERIVPARAAYWVSTVEAMPVDIGADFLAVDEIQLCGDPDRGHIFTDRLLNARGLHETLFLGSETMRARIASLVPGQQVLRRERFSELRYTGARKISRMPPRSAIVGFSVEDVYTIAELIRRQKGGAAVVMGALSPRTRNAQVALYQNGDVDYLVATDAIGMGLNLDISHVAFSGLVKFDGRRHRHLNAGELAQIAGRAGRFTQDGTFGVTGDASPLEPEVVEAIETHRFTSLSRLQWRNSALDFASPRHLIASLEIGPDRPDLARAREADDLATLKELAQMPDLGAPMGSAADVKLLWDVCQVPDFRKVSPDSHARLLATIYRHLTGPARVLPPDWVARQLTQIDRTEGDIDTLSQRIAYVRTWTYIAHQGDWLADAETWCARTRAIEDRLSDALHDRLTQRFVDRRTTMLMRQLKDRREFAVALDDDGGISLDGSFVGRIAGLSFQPDSTEAGIEGRALRAAAARTIAPLLMRRAREFAKAAADGITLGDDARFWWRDAPIARLAAGDHVLRPRIRLLIGDEVQGPAREGVAKRLDDWLAARLATAFAALTRLTTADLGGAARGLAYQLGEALGALPRAQVANQLAALGDDERAALRALGVRGGGAHVFLPALLKPAPTRLKVLLRAVAEERPPIAPPPAGRISLPVDQDVPASHWLAAGFAPFGRIAVRIDILERIAHAARELARRGPFPASPALARIAGCRPEELTAILVGTGYRVRETEAGPVFAHRRRDEAGRHPARRAEQRPAARLDHSPFAGLRHLRTS
jgi:ATP-dependent RNA helicase SUPV3L1/SUV3